MSWGFSKKWSIHESRQSLTDTAQLNQLNQTIGVSIHKALIFFVAQIQQRFGMTTSMIMRLNLDLVAFSTASTQSYAVTVEIQCIDNKSWSNFLLSCRSSTTRIFGSGVFIFKKKKGYYFFWLFIYKHKIDKIKYIDKLENY